MNTVNVRANQRRIDQSGINMVDLMMWLVIAALLLAAALQGIGYYQRAAFLMQIKSDASGAGAVIQANAAQNSGSIDVTAAQSGAAEAKWSANVTYVVEPSVVSGRKPILRVSHPRVTDVDAVYVFESCSGLQVGVNVLPKSGSPALESCLGIVTQSPLGAWSQSTSGTGTWYGVAASFDGGKLSAVRYNGYAYTSTNAGSSFTIQAGSGNRAFLSVASSSDGTKIIAADNNSSLMRSVDSGATWTRLDSAGTHSWGDVASSSDGTVLVARDSSGSSSVYVSNDSGTTWTTVSGLPTSPIWTGVDVSDDGTKIMAAQLNGGIWASTNSGSTWTKTSAPVKAWQKLSMSSDGTKILGSVDGGQLHISSDSGATWTAVAALGNSNWFGVGVSADGKTLAASQVNATGKIFVSTDSGATWSAQTGIPAGVYMALDVSRDGKTLVAGNYNGYIYIGKLG